MSLFDVDTFMQTQVSDAMDTKLIPIPEGETAGLIEKVELRPWQSRDGLKSGLALDVFWDVTDPAILAAVQRPKATIKQSVMLDTTEDGKGLELGKGKNIYLGRLREATGQNQAGVPFTFQNLVGQSAKILVKHRVEGEETYADVKGVAKL